MRRPSWTLKRRWFEVLPVIVGLPLGVNELQLPNLSPQTRVVTRLLMSTDVIA
jgi:hypothetical protein